MMRAVLLALILLLVVPAAALSRPARWEKPRVPVWDYSSDFWKPSVERMVMAYNAILPRRAPRFVYAPMGELSCDALPKYGKKGGITVCSGAALPDAFTEYESRRIVRSRIVLTESAETPDALVCHEVGHAVLDAPDDYARPFPDTSCVQGYLAQPGDWERGMAQRVYGKKRHR